MKKIIYIFFVVHSMFIGNAFADWSGPNEVVSGKWGKDIGEFGKGSDSVMLLFPRNNDIEINYRDEIFIYDEVNSKLLKYNNNGMLLKHELPNGLAPYIHESGCMMVFGRNWKKLFYNKYGEFLNAIKIKYSYYRLGEKGFWFMKTKYINDYSQATTFHLYSIKGEYIGQFDEKDMPEELQQKVIKNKQIQYEDGTVYKFSDKEIEKLEIVDFRDKFKSIYFIGGTVYRKSACNNNDADIFKSPESVIKSNLNNEKIYKEGQKFIVEYGPPIVSINGDVYCWKRTPATYSIQKWTWRDSPDSPIDLKSTPTKTTISLAWQAPEEDFAKVKEYEITRSSKLCGPFKPVATVKKDIHSFVDKKIKPEVTYYYKVQAVKEDKSYSGFSNKVNGIIQ